MKRHILLPLTKKHQKNIYEVINILNQRVAFLESLQVICVLYIVLSNSNILKILKLIKTKANMDIRNTTNNLKIYLYQYRIDINLNVTLMIFYYAKRLMLNYLNSIDNKLL